MIVTAPPATPVTWPVMATVATKVLLLVHDTAVRVVSLNTVVDPTHTVVTPKIADGPANAVLG